MGENIQIDIDPGRLLFGLSRIGYTTSSAICDIIDNSLRANAENITVKIVKERKDFSDSKRNNISEYLIIDDGEGMDRQGVLDALVLGSNNNYEEKSLSKFGLGLKSAAFSQGDKLEVISGKNETFFKFQISLPDIMAEKKYFASELQPSSEDELLISSYLKNGRGTIVRICAIRKNNHPSVSNTVTELKTKAGVIYYEFLKDGKQKIYVDNSLIQPIDPLFRKEADLNGNLNENEWDGTSVKWIEKKDEILLDAENNVKIKIEITQLPYPPIFRIKSLGENKDEEIRKKYLIQSGNYGFYVYRNNRLISWASHLNGIIPYDQDFYSFRGRISIDDSADDFFNIDVKKSTLTLSDDAWRIISDLTREARSKSQLAWKNAGKLRREIINKDPNEIANKLIGDFEQIEILPGDKLPSEEDALKRLEAISLDMAEKVKLIVKMMREDQGLPPLNEIPDLNEKERAIKGENNSELKKIFRVTSVLDNLLWEPYYDKDLGNCVRINKLHRFGIFIYETNGDNKDLQIIFDLLMLQMADSEFYAYKNSSDFDYEQVKSMLWDFRRIISDILANMVRKLENQLPPNYKDLED